jgi:hypothetical protein
MKIDMVMRKINTMTIYKPSIMTTIRLSTLMSLSPFEFVGFALFSDQVSEECDGDDHGNKTVDAIEDFS